jgi:hypothetical protein
VSDLEVFDVFAFDRHFRAAICPSAQSIERYIFPTKQRIAASEKAPDLFLRVHEDAGEFHLSAGDRLVASAGEPVKLVPDLIRLLDDEVVEHLKDFSAVHAGTVLLSGRALLLPGSSHCGKSSLVEELLRRGATYFSDEYALIDADGLAHPYARPLLVRNGKPTQSPLLAVECNASVGEAGVPVGWILSLVFQPGGSWNITQVPQSLGVMTLLQNTPHTLEDAPRISPFFQRAVAHAQCFVGKRGEASDAVDHIFRMTEQAGPV